MDRNGWSWGWGKQKWEAKERKRISKFKMITIEKKNYLNIKEVVKKENNKNDNEITSLKRKSAAVKSDWFLRAFCFLPFSCLFCCFLLLLYNVYFLICTCCYYFVREWSAGFWCLFIRYCRHEYPALSVWSLFPPRLF